MLNTVFNTPRPAGAVLAAALAALALPVLGLLASTSALAQSNPSTGGPSTGGPGTLPPVLSPPLQPMGTPVRLLTTCAGRVRIQSIAAISSNNHAYTYHVRVLNHSTTELRWTLTFANVPKGVKLNSGAPINSRLNPGMEVNMPFATSNAKEPAHHAFQILYDSASTTRPSATLSNCVPP